MSQAVTFVARLELTSKILTPYGDLVKNFKFLKEVKILSKFFQNKLACLNANLCQRKAGRKSSRLYFDG